MQKHVLKSGRHIKIAHGFQERLLGLMGRKVPLDNEGMYFPRCRSVHTFFMHFPIMLVFCREGKIVKLIPCLKPWRCSMCFEADSVFEFMARPKENQQALKLEIQYEVDEFMLGISPKKSWSG